ncbi:MAG: flagellar protein FlgN [Alcaligenaceae bacterium]|nr:flagellar protein FlgN [Alcaligenaceae bacterium]
MNPALDSLIECVTTQTAVVREFIAVLENEARTLLDPGSDEQLIDLTQRKSDFAAQLAQLDQQRTELLGTLNFGADQSGIQAACTQFPTLAAPFETLFELARQAAELNQRNGQIIQAFLADNQRAMATLRSLMGDDLYDAKGRITKPSSP